MKTGKTVHISDRHTQKTHSGGRGDCGRCHFTMHSPVVPDCTIMILIMLPGNLICYFSDSIWNSVVHTK